jgi:uncharacterized protein YoxC
MTKLGLSQAEGHVRAGRRSGTVAAVADFRLDVYVHLVPGETPDQLDRIEQKLDALALQEEQHMADLTALQNEVQQNTDAVGSAVTLIGGLAQQIRDLSTDPAALQALADQLDQNTQQLADAVTANTPADTGAAEQPPAEPPAEPPADGGDEALPPQ